MEPRIVLRSISKVYPAAGASSNVLFSAREHVAVVGDKLAVSNVSLVLERGERLGIVGRNGAGKSTLLHMIAGLASPSTGQIDITGHVTSVMTLGVGLRDDLTGRDNIYVDGEIQGLTRDAIDRVIDEVVAFADLGEFIEYPVRTYSTGMKARLAFSMISHIDPEILIIDEALSVGDADFSTKATARIKDICARGKIVILVSHSMQSVRDICNRCLWMEDGRVVMDGAPKAVTAAYIDAVRAEDEAQLMERFRRHVGSQSMRAGWSIEEVLIHNGNLEAPRALLEANMPTRFKIRGSIPRDCVDMDLAVMITRVDGLLVFDHRFGSQDCRSGASSVGLEIEMKNLVLGVAVYRLDAFLQCDGDVHARSSTIFEVSTFDPPTGGKPMLLYPISVTSVVNNNNAESY